MSEDLSFQLLWQAFNHIDGPALWLLDENPPQQLPPANSAVLIICNRFDVAQYMRAKGWEVTFSDFDFSALKAHSFHRIFYRISKEKALAHYIINSAKGLLIPDGQLIISGAKQQGIKGFIDRAAQIYQLIERYKADKQHWGASLVTQHSTEKLDDKDYQQLRKAVEHSDISFLSKPGIFGWNKIDRGSELLIEHLSDLQSEKDDIKRILDLGCGYGYLSVLSAQYFNAHITATDNNATALIASQANLQALQIPHEIIADNCAQSIRKPFDLIVCNPPFHTGFAVENDLTDQFLHSASRLLMKGATALFVVNLHIPLERKAAGLFSHIELISDDKHFKVIKLKK